MLRPAIAPSVASTKPASLRVSECTANAAVSSTTANFAAPAPAPALRPSPGAATPASNALRRHAYSVFSATFELARQFQHRLVPRRAHHARQHFLFQFLRIFHVVLFLAPAFSPPEFYLRQKGQLS